MSIVPHRHERNPHPQERVAETRPTIAPRHWYVAGAGGYCQACGLPARNTHRHAPRPV